MLPDLPAISLADIGYAWRADLFVWLGVALVFAALAVTAAKIVRQAIGIRRRRPSVGVEGTP